MSKYLEDFRQGDTYTISVKYPVGTDISGYTHSLKVKANFDSDDYLLNVSSVAGEHPDDDLDNTTGPIVYIEASAAETSLIETGRHVYVVQFVSPNGEVKSVLPPASYEEYKDRVFVAPAV